MSKGACTWSAVRDHRKVRSKRDRSLEAVHHLRQHLHVLGRTSQRGHTSRRCGVRTSPTRTCRPSTPTRSSGGVRPVEAVLRPSSGHLVRHPTPRRMAYGLIATSLYTRTSSGSSHSNKRGRSWTRSTLWSRSPTWTKGELIKEHTHIRGPESLEEELNNQHMI